MAAGLLRHYLPDELRQCADVTSAGTHALHGHQAHDHAIAAMSNIGIDISDHRARQITREMARGSDLILVMEANHGDIVKRLLGWSRNKPRMIGEFHPQHPLGDIADPYGRPLEAYQVCIQTLQPCIEGVRQWLVDSIV
jgi:protein-tyrosine-phosphatase